MAFSVHFGVRLETIPEDARQEVHRTMEQIAEVVASIPPMSAFWGSMDDSLLKIDVGRFRVVYRVDPIHRELVVIEVAPIRR